MTERKKVDTLANSADSEPFVAFVETEGSPVVVGSGDKRERIQRTVDDLRLTIDGCIARTPEQLDHTIPAFARACSIFLRKMVIGDRGEGGTRLLDGAICGEAEFDFDRIRRVPRERESVSIVQVDARKGFVEIVKLNDDTLEPEGVQVIPIGPQRLEIVVEWPLPGMAGCSGPPTPEVPWELRDRSLFDVEDRRRLDCDQWLGQQLVILDNRGISLKKLISVTTNTEGAHAPAVHRLQQVKGERRSRTVQDMDVHILSHIRGCGVRYSHAIVIETALYLYGKLIDKGVVTSLEGGSVIPVFGFPAGDHFTPGQDWLTFEGGLSIAFGGRAQLISHRVKAPL